MQANPDKLQPEWEELAATSCAVQNLALTATALGVAGMLACSLGLTMQTYALLSDSSSQTSADDDGQPMSTPCMLVACYVSQLNHRVHVSLLNRGLSYWILQSSLCLIWNPLSMSAVECAILMHKTQSSFLRQSLHVLSYVALVWRFACVFKPSA